MTRSRMDSAVEKPVLHFLPQVRARMARASPRASPKSLSGASRRSRYALTADSTYAPGKSTAHDAAIQREKETGKEKTGKGFKGTLYHGSPNTDIEEFDINRAGTNTSTGEKLIFFTDSKQMADDFSYERLEGSSMFTNRRGKKGRVYEVDVEMKHPLDFRNLSDTDIDNILKLDIDGILTRETVKMYAEKNHQLLKSGLELTSTSLMELGYDGLIANAGKAGHNSTEYAVVDSKQAKIRKSAPTVAKTFDDVLKFNPYHDSRGRFASSNSATSFTIRTKDPAKQHLADAAAARERERDAAGAAAPAGEKETPRMQSIHSVEDKIRNQNYESAAIIDKDGNELLFKDGASSSVGFTPMECAMMKDNTLTHNHPRSSMFSDEDIKCFTVNDMQEIRATTREGITYSIKRSEGYSRADGQVFLLEYQINSGLARATAQSELDARGFAQKIMRGEMSHTEANKEFGKVVTRELTSFCEKKAPDYNLEFTVENRSVGKSAAGTDDDYIAKSLDDDGIILDKETEAANDAAFNEWLEKNHISPEGTTEKSFSIYKTSDDKRLVFGWASVSITVDGEQLEDHQKDLIDPEDLEEAAYEYVLNFRDTGEEHNQGLRKKGKLVESCVFTAEKQKAMGIPEGILPIAWWIGFKIEDDEAWEKVKNGTYRMFSIEGRANRVPVEKATPAEPERVIDPDRFIYVEVFP